MGARISNDPRIDPRTKAIFAMFPDAPAEGDVASRDELVAEYNSEAADQRAAEWKAMGDAMNNDLVAPSAGLTRRVERLVSAPDGNEIRILFIRPDNEERLPCAYYIHGGDMVTNSCFDGIYEAWSRIIAAPGRSCRHGGFPQRAAGLVGA